MSWCLKIHLKLSSLFISCFGGYLFAVSLQQVMLEELWCLRTPGLGC